jgi:DNA repair photolyase
MSKAQDPPQGTPRARKGRGAVSNPTPRFAEHDRDAVDDGWGSSTFGALPLGVLPHPCGSDSGPPVPRTNLHLDSARSILSRNDSPDVPFDRSLNPYRGCQHGCIYCYARPSHAYLGLSPGLDFETEIFYKPEAPALLRAELARPGYRPAPVALGSNTDAYQPSERRLRITRGLLEVLHVTRHPVVVITKSDLVLRDLELLADLARERLAAVLVSITTLDSRLARRLEPRASAPCRRLVAIEGLASAGVPCGVLVSPVILGLTDHEIERILAAASQAGATQANHIILRLPLELGELFQDWLLAHYPDRAGKVLSLLRQCRDGRLNDPRFGARMRGSGPIADLIAKRFTLAVRRLGLGAPGEAWDLATDRFAPPAADGRQLSLGLL